MRKSCRDSYASWLFFIVGIIATIAMRVVTVLMYTNPVYGKVAWYIGVTGFFAFFIYKFQISQTRSKLIDEKNIQDKIDSQSQLTEEDYRIISGILCSLRSRKERVNFIFIFVLSAVALLAAIYVDFF